LESGIEIVATKIEIAERDKGFTGWIIALPDDIQHMATHALRKIHREAVGICIQYGIGCQGKLLEVGPLDWLRGIVCVFRNVNFKAAWRVRDRGREAGIVATGLDFSGGPIYTRQVKSGIFRAASAGELTVGNEVAVIVLRNEDTNLMPIIKSLRSSDGNRRLSGITRR
jgi:hypothetical protein